MSMDNFLPTLRNVASFKRYYQHDLSHIINPLFKTQREMSIIFTCGSTKPYYSEFPSPFQLENIYCLQTRTVQISDLSAQDRSPFCIFHILNKISKHPELMDTLLVGNYYHIF